MNKSLITSDQKPVSLVILGPHRCGTSALSGVLKHLGADIPETLMPASGDNPLGYFESLRVMAFNDKLLKALGSNWKDLSPLDLGSFAPQVFESFISEAVGILHEEFSAARLPLLKDPRICRLAGFWDEAFIRLGYQPLYIHTHRNPLETADSLKKRDGIPVEVGLLIWLRHVLDAEAATRGKTRVFTNYKALLDDWHPQVAQIEKRLGLSFHRNSITVRQDIDNFLSNVLHRQRRAEEDVSRSMQVADVVRDVFRILENWTSNAENPSNYNTLDHLRRRLDGSLDQVAIFMRAQEEDQKRLHENLRDRERDLHAYEKNVQERLEEITKISELLLESQKQREAEQKTHAAQIAALNRMLLEVQRQRDKEVLARAKSETHVRALLSSTSWRMTAPMRRMATFLRQNKNRFSNR